MQTDEDSTRPFHRHGKIEGTACVQDRAIRDMQKEVKSINARLAEGDAFMVRLDCTMDNLTQTTKENMATMKELIVQLQSAISKSPSIGQKILDAFITWSVPGVIFMIFWVAVNSGVVNIPISKPTPQAQSTQTTGAHP